MDLKWCLFDFLAVHCDTMLTWPKKKNQNPQKRLHRLLRVTDLGLTIALSTFSTGKLWHLFSFNFLICKKGITNSASELYGQNWLCKLYRWRDVLKMAPSDCHRCTNKSLRASLCQSSNYTTLNNLSGTSLAVQCLRLHLPMQGVWVLIPSHMPPGQKTKA